MLRSAMLQRNWQEQKTALARLTDGPDEPAPPGGDAGNAGHVPKRFDHAAKCIK